MQTMIHIPEELLEQAERGNVLLFVGDHESRVRSAVVIALGQLAYFTDVLGFARVPEEDGPGFHS